MTSKCIEDTGRILVLNNQDIVKYLCSIEEERNTLETIIQKQYQERKKIEAEIEKLTYKLCLINKSLSMRIKAKNNYDKTIDEIKNHYEKLVDSSNTLRQIVEKTQQELDDIMNKKTGTGGPNGEEVRMLYVKQNETNESDQCPCTYMLVETPTKDDEYVANATGPPAPLPPRQNTSEDSQDNHGTLVYPSSAVPVKPPFESTIAQHFENHNQPEVQQRSSIKSTTSQPKKDSSRILNNRLRSSDGTEQDIGSITSQNETRNRSQTSSIVEATLENLAHLNIRRSPEPTIGSEEKMNGPLPDLNKLTPENPTTNLLISRLRTSLTTKPRLESKIIPPYDQTKHDVTSISNESTGDNIGKIEKRSVTEVLQAATHNGQ